MSVCVCETRTHDFCQIVWVHMQALLLTHCGILDKFHCLSVSQFLQMWNGENSIF